jgi:hypothetical protein
MAVTRKNPRHDHIRVERLKDAGVSPSAARKPTLLDEWDLVRAAQHMIEQYGGRAAETAERRADASRELQFVKRWQAIAETIRILQSAS